MRLSGFARDMIARAYRVMIDSGGAGSVALYTGEMPKSTDTPAKDEVIALFTFGEPCGEVDAHALCVEATGDAKALYDGSPTWGRVFSGSGRALFDLTVGATGSDADLIVHPIELVKEGPVRLDSFKIAVGR